MVRLLAYVLVARALAEMFATIWSGTRVVVIEKFVPIAPAGTVTVPAAGAKNGWSDSMNRGLSAGTIPFGVTVEMAVLPAKRGSDYKSMPPRSDRRRSELLPWSHRYKSPLWSSSMRIERRSRELSGCGAGRHGNGGGYDEGESPTIRLRWTSVITTSASRGIADPRGSSRGSEQPVRKQVRQGPFSLRSG
jgi:hypothetical protein